MKKRAFKKFLVVILIFTLILPNFISAIGIAASAEFKLTDENGNPVQGNHFPSKQAVYIYSDTMLDGHYYVEVTTSSGQTVLSNHNGTVDVINGSFGPTNLWDLVGGYGDTKIFKVSLNTDPEFPGSSNFSKTFDVVDIEGSILVEKTFNEGVTDTQTFDVVVTGPNDYYEEITISQGNPITLSDLPAGDYMLVEEDLLNYNETNGIIYITISESVQYTASFLNEEYLGSLVITKAVEDAPEDMTPFGLTVSGPDGYEFTTQAFAQDSQVELTGLSFGLYTITEDGDDDYIVPAPVQVNINEETEYTVLITNIPTEDPPPETYTISGYVFIDTPEFDYSDVEMGIYGVTMELEGTEMSTMTDMDGYYEFIELEADDYTVLADTQSFISDAAVSDKDGTADGEYMATVGPDQVDVNFGYYTSPPPPETYTISGILFEDTPAFDYSDVEANRYEGVVVQLTGGLIPSSTLVTTTTDADGYYEFTDLLEGDYAVHADFDNDINEDNVSEKDQSVNGVYPSHLDSDETDVNFGYYTSPPPPPPETYSISGYVFTDTPAFDYSDVESGRYAEVTIELEGTQMSTTTDSEGYYEFAELEEGTYTVLADTGSIISDNEVSDKDGTADGEYIATVGPDQDDVNFGYYTSPPPPPPETYTISGYVFTDTPTFDYSDVESERYVRVTMELEGTQMSTTTDSEGYYEFAELEEGTYTVLADTGSIISDNEVSDKDGTADGEYIATVGPDQDDVNFGYYTSPPPPPEYGLDIDKSVDDDRIQLGQSVTWKIIVTNTGDEPLYSVEVTDDREGYLGTISILDPGSENSVEFSYTETPTSKGTIVNTATAVAPEQAGPVEDDAEVEVYKKSERKDPDTYTLSGYIFEDLNANNVLDDEDEGYEGITVELYDDDELVDTDKTDSNGKYSFSDLDGTYTVVVDPEGEIPNEFDSADQVSEYDDTLNQEVEVKVNENIKLVNFGYIGTPLALPTIISGNVFNDLNEDNIVDMGEVGYSSVEVTLWDGATPVLTKATDTSGQYVFNFALDPELADLGPGLYVVSIGDTPVNIYQVSEYDGAPFNQMVILTVEEDTIIIPNVNFGFKDNVVQSGETVNIPMILAGLFLITSGIIIRKKSYLTNN